MNRETHRKVLLGVKEFFMKSLSIPAVFVAAIATGAAFAQLPEVQPQPAPKGTVAQAVDDATITSKVKDAIASDPALKDMEFTVETMDSVVTLNGTANARDQIARAVALARAVPGVKAVTNILAVKTS
jgi:hyperosmotically inducible protein